MNTDSITPLVITFNEVPNLRRVLAGLAWARRIVVLDSGSTDGTLEMCAEFPQVEVMTRGFDSFAGQCNFGLQQIHTEWVLSCDADYIAEEAFLAAVRALPEEAEVSGYSVPFTYCIYGRKLRGGLYPARTALYRVAGAVYRNDGHGHKVTVVGPVKPLSAPLLHDDRKPLARWLQSQLKYAAQEAEKLATAEPRTLGWPDTLRRTGWAAPFVMLPYCLLIRRGLWDGWAGWFYAAQRVFAELLLALYVVDRRLREGKSGAPTAVAR
jgi:glycosyltransferase involved in cell wall biosynthesis